VCGEWEGKKGKDRGGGRWWWSQLEEKGDDRWLAKAEAEVVLSGGEERKCAGEINTSKQSQSQ
jgi:hypothetical protein